MNRKIIDLLVLKAIIFMHTVLPRRRQALRGMFINLENAIEELKRRSEEAFLWVKEVPRFESDGIDLRNDLHPNYRNRLIKVLSAEDENDWRYFKIHRVKHLLLFWLTGKEPEHSPISHIWFDLQSSNWLGYKDSLYYENQIKWRRDGIASIEMMREVLSASKECNHLHNLVNGLLKTIRHKTTSRNITTNRKVFRDSSRRLDLATEVLEHLKNYRRFQASLLILQHPWLLRAINGKEIPYDE